MSITITIVLLWVVEARNHSSRKGKHGRGGWVPCFETVLGGASTQGLQDGWEEMLLQDLRWQAEQWDRAVRAALLAGLPYLQKRDDDGVLPNCRDVNSGNWEVEELHQEGKLCSPRWRRWSKVSPSGNWGGGRSRLPNSRCDACHVKRPVWGVHETVNLPHLPSESPTVLDWIGNELPVEGLCNPFELEWVFLSNDWDVWWGTRPLAA